MEDVPWPVRWLLTGEPDMVQLLSLLLYNLLSCEEPLTSLVFVTGVVGMEEVTRVCVRLLCLPGGLHNTRVVHLQKNKYYFLWYIFITLDFPWKSL